MDFMEVQNVAKLLIAGLRVGLEHQDTVDGDNISMSGQAVG